MKLVFLGAGPGPALQTALQSHSIEFKVLGTPVHPLPEADCMVWQMTRPEQIPQASNLRPTLADAWIVWVVPDEWLQDPALYAELLAHDKDDVWLQSQWEAGFWLGLQRAVQTLAARRRTQQKNDSLRALHDEHDEIAAMSQSLVTGFKASQALTTEIHKKFYPQFSTAVPGVQIHSKYVPASGPGGDYFDLFEFADKRHFGLLLADCTHHRAAANLLSVLLQLRLEDLRGKYRTPEAFIGHLNTCIEATPESNGALNLLYAVMDRATCQLQLASAGSLVIRLWRAGQLAPVAQPAFPPLITDPQTTWTSQRLDLAPGDTLLFATDGLGKALNGLDLLRSLDPQDPLDMRNTLVSRLPKASALKDDLTFVLMHLDADARFMRQVAQS